MRAHSSIRDFNSAVNQFMHIVEKGTSADVGKLAELEEKVLALGKNLIRDGAEGHETALAQAQERIKKGRIAQVGSSFSGLVTTVAKSATRCLGSAYVSVEDRSYVRAAKLYREVKALEAKEHKRRGPISKKLGRLREELKVAEAECALRDAQQKDNGSLTTKKVVAEAEFALASAKLDFTTSYGKLQDRKIVRADVKKAAEKQDLLNSFDLADPNRENIVRRLSSKSSIYSSSEDSEPVYEFSHTPEMAHTRLRNLKSTIDSAKETIAHDEAVNQEAITQGIQSVISPRDITLNKARLAVFEAEYKRDEIQIELDAFDQRDDVVTKEEVQPVQERLQYAKEALEVAKAALRQVEETL